MQILANLIDSSCIFKSIVLSSAGSWWVWVRRNFAKMLNINLTGFSLRHFGVVDQHEVSWWIGLIDLKFLGIVSLGIGAKNKSNFQIESVQRIKMEIKIMFHYSWWSNADVPSLLKFNKWKSKGLEEFVLIMKTPTVYLVQNPAIRISNHTETRLKPHLVHRLSKDPNKTLTTTSSSHLEEIKRWRDVEGLLYYFSITRFRTNFRFFNFPTSIRRNQFRNTTTKFIWSDVCLKASPIRENQFIWKR